MSDFFAGLFEFLGLNPFYSRDLRDHLSGYDLSCSGYEGTPTYLIVGVAMLVITSVIYVLYYHVVNSSSLNKWIHWWTVAIGIFVLNFLLAAYFPFIDLQSGSFCNQLHFNVRDCVGFGLSVALWSFIWFFLLTSFPVPRAFAGANMTHTTFWKPKL
jgi:hypothetical protein